MQKNKNFTYTNYIDSLNKLKEKHKFSFFETFSKNDVILRHDIDISLEPALKIAEIEYKKNIFSTYFILFHSPFYNPFSTKSTQIIKKIRKMGHKIGLHYDSSYYIQNNLSPNKMIKHELEVFNQHFNDEINLISAHQPTINKKIQLKLNKKIINVDSLKFRKNRKYISDSVQNWREGSIEKFTDYSQLYILTHPIWWTKKGLSRKLILKELVGGKFDEYKKSIKELKKLQDQYLINLKK